jgi:hypothetical protein
MKMKITGEPLAHKACKDSIDLTPLGSYLGKIKHNGEDNFSCVQTDEIKFFGSMTEKKIKVPRLVVHRCQGDHCYSKAEIERRLSSGDTKIGIGLRKNFIDFENYERYIQFKPDYPEGPGIILDPKMSFNRLMHQDIGVVSFMDVIFQSFGLGNYYTKIFHYANFSSS